MQFNWTHLASSDSYMSPFADNCTEEHYSHEHYICRHRPHENHMHRRCANENNERHPNDNCIHEHRSHENDCIAQFAGRAHYLVEFHLFSQHVPTTWLNLPNYLARFAARAHYLVRFAARAHNLRSTCTRNPFFRYKKCRNLSFVTLRNKMA